LEIPARTVDETARKYLEADMRAVLLAWDAQTATCLPPVRNDFVAWVVPAHPSRLSRFSAVDPLKGER
jgi:hypothetical protein